MTVPAGTQAMSSRSAHLVRFESLRLGSRRHPLVSDCSLAILPGQFWVFVMDDGALRRSLVRMLLGIAKPDAGTVEWNRSFSTSTVTARIGFVPHAYPLPSGASTTVREFITLGLVGIAPGGAGEDQRIAWALDQFALGPIEKADVACLSRTERLFLLFARALARRPRLLVVEDPTFDLDREACTALMDVLARLERNERLSVAWFTTDLELAEQRATHIAVPTESSLRTARRSDPEFSATLALAKPPAPPEDVPPFDDDITDSSYETSRDRRAGGKKVG